MDNNQIYASFRLVAEYADGSRLLFDDLTQQAARRGIFPPQNGYSQIVFPATSSDPRKRLHVAHRDGSKKQKIFAIPPVQSSRLRHAHFMSF